MTDQKILKISKNGNTRITQTNIGKTVDIHISNRKHWVTMAAENGGDNIKSWFEYYSGEIWDPKINPKKEK